MKRILLCALVALAVGAFSRPAAAADIGVVFMHGKWGTAGAKSPIAPLVAALERSDFLVEARDIPWSRDRAYDRDVEGALAEIDGLVQRLKQRGAKRVVVGGQSIGANIAMAYGARRDGLAGIMAIAPGHTPDLTATRNAVGADVERARKMIAEGKGAATAQFADFNQGRNGRVTASAQAYASWMDPDGAAVMPRNAAALKPGAPLLWVIGANDGLLQRGEAYAYAKAPAHPKNTYKVVKGGHADTPAVAAAEIVAWLKGL